MSQRIPRLRHAPACRTRAAAGQSTVEFALVAPLVVYCALVLLGTIGTCLDVVRLNEVARSAARAAITAHDPAAAAGVVADRFSVSARTVVDERYGLVTVTVAHRRVVPLPLVGRLLPRLEIVGASTMVREPPVVLG